ncbi:MAG: type II toxin-antitoxin system YafQ family toxin [Bacteroidales bacterium]|nr:type II toxin-antitoxin system YafQ family toxin [Candidatus Scybalocola fimicaballi]
MKEVRYSTKAKKDLKKYRNDLDKMRDLYEVLTTLASGGTLDAKYRPHMLTGNYKDCMECHVGNDFLLIWIDTDAIYVERVGSHSELFK